MLIQIMSSQNSGSRRTGEEDAGTDAGAPPGAEGKASVSEGMPSTFTSTIFLRVSLYHF